MDFLDTFRMHNMKRAVENFDHPIDEVWWTNAIAGEGGEALAVYLQACNLSKKISRGDFKAPEQLNDARYRLAVEIADVMTYCDLLLGHLGYDTKTMLATKFNEVSRRVGYPQVEF